MQNVAPSQSRASKSATPTDIPAWVSLASRKTLERVESAIIARKLSRGRSLPGGSPGVSAASALLALRIEIIQYWLGRNGVDPFVRQNKLAQWLGVHKSQISRALDWLQESEHEPIPQDRAELLSRFVLVPLSAVGYFAGGQFHPTLSGDACYALLRLLQWREDYAARFPDADRREKDVPIAGSVGETVQDLFPVLQMNPRTVRAIVAELVSQEFLSLGPVLLTCVKAANRTKQLGKGNENTAGKPEALTCREAANDTEDQVEADGTELSGSSVKCTFSNFQVHIQQLGGETKCTFSN